MGCAFHDALARVMRRCAMGGGHVTRRDAERVCDETSGISPGPSGCRDGVGTGVERVITSGPVISPRMWLKYLMQMMIKKIRVFFWQLLKYPSILLVYCAWNKSDQ